MSREFHTAILECCDLLGDVSSMWTQRWSFLALLLWGAVSAAHADDFLSYSRDIRPILSKNCFACHGPDDLERKGDTRLDVSGEADLTAVLERLISQDADEVMPPPESNKVLKADEIELLSRWIQAGAPYEKHWAFVPPVKTAVPEEAHPVDHLIGAGASAVKLADPYSQMRRVYLDLIGLPPSPEQADAFAADPSDEAYQVMVESLLDSERYGERWARRWLDLARYADTNGYEKDRDRSIWPYRDWVIRVLNADMPFDQFTIEQLAGDMLPDPTPDQLVATGFHRNTMLNEEGGIDPLEFRYHAMTDRVATTGTTWLGLTTGCAQCHTHKYDPITHHDYFGMMAYLNNADEPDYFLPREDASARTEERFARVKELLAELPSHWPKEGVGLEAAFEEWQEHDQVSWQTLNPLELEANVPYLVQEADGVVFAGGDTSKRDHYTLRFEPQGQEISAIRLEALADERLPAHGPGMTYYEGPKGDFFLSEFQIRDEEGALLEIASTSETYAKNSFGGSPATAAQAVDGDLQSGWSIKQGEGRSHVAVFNLAQPLPKGTSFTLQMHFGRHYASSLGKFRLSGTKAEGEVRATLSASDGLSEKEAFLLQAIPLAEKAAEIHKLRRPVLGVPTLILRERPPGRERVTHLHHRGEFTQAKEAVPPRLPTALWPEDKTPPKNRLEFARWLVSRENPLTARVVMNRQWAAFFGTGIVKTLDDFGMQGGLPSHPELLDYLAVELMDQGWSMKALHRLIVTSRTYRQASGKDGGFPRTRLEAEIIRDAALAASGLLDRKMFGPPVRPLQPAEAAANYSKSTWKASEGSERHRRSVYTYLKRTAPFAMFTTFDAASGEACVARRDVSNTPLQALTLMNDPMFVEVAEAYGKRMDAVAGDVRAKVMAGFRWLLTRPPSEREIGALIEFHEKHASWPGLARVLLSLDETVTKN